MNHYSLHDFNRLIKTTLSNQLESSYWIIAEIGQISLHTHGHCYLELVEKDHQHVKAKSKGTIWANAFREIHPWFVAQTGTELKQGMKILFNASLEYHEIYGMNLNIRDIDVNFSIGERERKKQETIQQLETEGVMDMNSSLELPIVIQRIAIISSETAAGYEDFMHQWKTNPYEYYAEFDLFPSVMQGDAAPKSIIDSLHRIHESENEYDAVILIRGGGSKMDLDCFDDYELCAHIAQFPLPVLTGIGHERDQSIADMVAHTQLKTPTSVAEFLISKLMAFESEIHNLQEVIGRYVQHVLKKQVEHISEMNFSWKMNVKQALQKHSYAVEHVQNMIMTRPKAIIHHHNGEINNKKKLIEAYNPVHLLNKGYSITRLNGVLLKNQKITEGDELETQTANRSTITSIITTTKK